MVERTAIAVALSGSGRTLTNLLEHQKHSTSSYRVVGVVSSNANCLGVEIARSHQLPVFIQEFPRHMPAGDVAALYDWLSEQRVKWVALAGFLKIWPIRPDWQRRLINIHPALLPKFGGHGMYGDRVHRAVLEAGCKETGATCHFVDDQYDRGAVVARVRVKVQPDDTTQQLAARVFAAECQLYPHVLSALIRSELPLPEGMIYEHEIS